MVEEEVDVTAGVFMFATVPTPEVEVLDLLKTAMICRRFSIFFRSSSSVTGAMKGRLIGEFVRMVCVAASNATRFSASTPCHIH